MHVWYKWNSVAGYFPSPKSGADKLCSCHAGGSIVYTYDVFWEVSKVSWASRWDAYLNMPGGRVQTSPAPVTQHV